MQNESSNLNHEVLVEIRNWIRAASHATVARTLSEALPDAKSRSAYQLLDGTASMEQVRVKCKMSPNVLLALANKCTSLGLMELTVDKRRKRLFDLRNFELIDRETTN